MSRFWAFVGVIFAVGIVMLAVQGQEPDLEVRDLETHCRSSIDSHQKVSLQDDRLKFDGAFPINNPNSDLKADYSNSDGKIVLDIKVQKMDVPASFWDTCLGMAVYDIRTPELEHGSYNVVVRHDGKKVDEIRVRVE